MGKIIDINSLRKSKETKSKSKETEYRLDNSSMSEKSEFVGPKKPIRFRLSQDNFIYRFQNTTPSGIFAIIDNSNFPEPFPPDPPLAA